MLDGSAGDEDSLERVEVFTKITRIPDINRVAFAAFDGGRDRFAPDGGFNNIVYIAHGETVTSGFDALDVEIEKIAASGALGENAARVGKIGESLLDLNGDILNRAE